MYVVMLYEKSWSSECRTFKVNGSFSRGRPRKSWSEVRSSYSKDLVIDKNASVLSNHLIINHMIDCNQHCTVNSVIL